jgi:germination protein M
VKRVALVLVVILIVSMFLTGCVLTDKLSSLKQSFKKAETPPDATTPTVIIEPQGSAPAVAGAVKTIVLYFADSTGSKLVAEERQIPKVEGIGRASIEELIKGPALAELRPTLPATTKLLDINIRTDGLGIVDFSGDLIKDLPASAAAEKLAIYSVVNTLTQFPTVEKVEIRVDGRKVDTLLGHEKIDENLVRNTSLIN